MKFSNRYVLISLLSFFVLTAGLAKDVTVKVHAEDDNVIHVSSYQELLKAADEINNADAGSFTIVLDNDISFSGDSLEFTKNAVVIDGQGHLVQGETVSGNGAYITVKNGGNLSLENLTVTGTQNGPYTLAAASGSSSVLNLKSGTVLRDNYCNGGAGGVQADNGSTVNMYDGAVIENCTSESAAGGGGVLTGTRSTFNMTGGTISNCTSTGSQAGGGGISISESAVVKMSGGTIEDCRSTGDAYYGGGICMLDDASSLTITGGTIRNCIADRYYGGGIFAIGGNVSISNLTVTGCQAPYGGGIVLYDCGKQVLSHAAVTENSAGLGGGLLIRGTDLDGSGSVIANNFASTAGADIMVNRDASINLPDASGMNQIFEAYGSEDGSDLKKAAGHAVDGWYEDDDPRYVPSTDGQKVSSFVNGPSYLTASYQIRKSKLVIEVHGSQETVLYDGRNHQPDLTYTCSIDGQKAVLPEGIQISLHEGSMRDAVNAGTYDYDLSGDCFDVKGADNYDVSFVIAKQPSVTISRRRLKLRVDLAKARQGHNAAESVTVTGDGFAEGEGASYEFPGSGEISADTLQIHFNESTLGLNYEIEKEEVDGHTSASSQKKTARKAENVSEENVNTGDRSHVIQYGVLLVICACVIIILYAVRRKSRK